MCLGYSSTTKQQTPKSAMEKSGISEKENRANIEMIGQKYEGKNPSKFVPVLN
jgi:hypothetical protein